VIPAYNEKLRLVLNDYYCKHRCTLTRSLMALAVHGALCLLFLPQVIWLDHGGHVIIDGLEWDFKLASHVLGIDNGLKEDAKVSRYSIFL